MWGEKRTWYTQLLPEYLEIPFKVADGDFRIVLCTKNEVPWGITKESEEVLAKFGAKGYESVLSSFPKYFKNQVVQVNVLFRQSKHLAGSLPCPKS